ncbi:MAG TPA: VanW family protein [Candidatus Limnocylindrales bacterium]|nr:VanW family protein [Candidatus Limnocylindrales bacterium]
MTLAPQSTEVVDSPAPSGRSRRLLPRFAVAFALGLVAVLVLGVGALFAYDQQYHGRILPGVRVGTIDLSGLTAETAAARLHEAYDGVATGRVVLIAGDKEIALPYSRARRVADVDAMVAKALSVGRAGNPVERAIANARTAFRGVVIAPQVRYDPDSLARWVTALAAAQHGSPTDATITRTKTGYKITPSVTGRQADPTNAIATLTEQLARFDAPTEIRVELPFAELVPAVTTEEATAAADAAERIAADVKIVEGKDSWTIPAATIRAWITFRATADGGYEPLVSSANIEKALAPVAKGVARAARNASFKVSGSKVVGVIPSAMGRALDTKGTAAKVNALLEARAAGGPTTEVVASLTTTEPSLTTAEAAAAAPKMKAISSHTTWFPISERNHWGANIWIPALDIDGTVVAPGEVFDFWKAVGPVTRERGYGAGGAIINGKTEPQGALAGGICSSSTTLFNAALKAGYQMGARRNHYYFIDRYPTGLDATVFKSSSGSVQTMSWTNDTAYPVLIRGYKIRDGGTGYVKFVLYSVPTARRVVISTPTIKNVRPATDTIVYTSTLAPGARERIEYPVAGKDVWRTVTVYQGGKIIHQTTYYSHYARITGVTLVGKGAAPADTSGTPQPTPTP